MSQLIDGADTWQAARILLRVITTSIGVVATEAQSVERPEQRSLQKAQLCSDVSSIPSHRIQWKESLLEKKYLWNQNPSSAICEAKRRNKFAVWEGVKKFSIGRYLGIIFFMIRHIPILGIFSSKRDEGLALSYRRLHTT